MIRKLLNIFKPKEPYWNEFYLNNIDSESKSGGFEIVLQNIESEATVFESRNNVRDFIAELVPKAIWVEAEGHFTLDLEGEAILIKLGIFEHVSGITVTVKCFGPPKNAVEIANAITQKYSLKISGWGNNPHVA